MIKCSTIAAVILVLAVESQATTVLQKSYGYRYEPAQDMGSDGEYVICAANPRSPLVPELKAPQLELRLGGQAIAHQHLTDPVNIPSETPSRSRSSEYRLEKTVLFGFDSVRVEDGRNISLLATTLKTDPSVTAIRVKGFTCDIGTKEYNDRLAMRRAVSVGSLLGKAGLQIDEVSGEGKCCYVPGERKLSRRVEILIMRSLGGGNIDAK